MGDKTVFLLQHFHTKKERWDRSHRFWVGSIGWVSPVGLGLPRGFRVQMFRVYLGSRAPLWRRDTKIGRQDSDTKIGRQDRDSEKNRGRRDSCIYILRASDRKKMEGVRAGGAAHIQCRGFAAAAGGVAHIQFRGFAAAHQNAIAASALQLR